MKVYIYSQEEIKERKNVNELQPRMVHFCPITYCIMSSDVI